MNGCIDDGLTDQGLTDHRPNPEALPESRAVSCPKVLLVAWDGVDWDLLAPLIEIDQLPTIASLIEQGMVGDLASLQPQTPALLWTSMATGMTADRHGVLDHLSPDPLSAELVPLRSDLVREKSLWRLLADAGFLSHAVNWYGSHPAEPLSGLSVSDRFAALAADSPDAPWPLASGAVCPAEQAEDLSRVRCHPGWLNAGDLEPYIQDLAAIDPALDRRPLEIAAILAATASVNGAVRRILEQHPWHFLAVRFPAIAQLSSRFMACQAPRLEGVSETDEHHYGQVVAAVLRLHDAMLGQLLRIAGPSTSVLLVSEQGIRSGAMRPKLPTASASGSGLGWLRRHGLLAMAGPPFRRDDLLHDASLLDVAPTVLQLFGLPATEGMAGAVLRQAFVAPPAVLVPVQPACVDPAPAPSCQDSWPELLSLAEPGFEHEAVKQLLALGFPLFSAEEQQQQQQHRLRSQYNLAQVHLQSGRWQAAIPLLEEVIQQPQVSPLLRLHLAYLNLRCGRLGEASRVAEAVRQLEGSSCLVLVVLALIAVARNQLIEALQLLKEAEQDPEPTPFAQGRLALAWIQIGRLGNAERCLRQSLQRDPHDSSLRLALAAVLLDRRKHRQALGQAQLALGQLQRLAGAHALLGLALWRCGEQAQAREAFEAALDREPPLAIRGRIEAFLASWEATP
jgi:tetratricopeptide (TPR) repeat protein